MGKIKEFFGLERRSVMSISNILPSYLSKGSGGEITISGIYNDYAATNLSAVYSCIDLIATNIAKLPMTMADDREGKGEVKNHPALNLFSRDNDNLMTGFDIIKYLVTSTLLKGNGYAYIQRAADGITPVMLRFLEPSDVTIYYDKMKDTLYYQCPYINNAKKIDPMDMLHFKVWSINGVEGVSVIDKANRTIYSAANLEIAANKMFGSGMTQKGILSPQTNLQGTQAEQIKETWDGNTSTIHVLRTPMQFTPLTLNSSDAQMLQSREFSVEEICRWFHVPSALITGKASFASLEMLQQMFYQNCLSGHISMIEAELNKKLLRPSEKHLTLYLDTNELLRAVKKDSAAYYQTLVAGGILTANEARKDLGMPPIEGGDDLRIAYSDANQNALNNNQEEKEKEDNEENI